MGPHDLPAGPAGMDPVQRARYDAAVQRYHDTVAAHRERFESQLAKAREHLAELKRRNWRDAPGPANEPGPGGDVGGVTCDARGRAGRGPSRRGPVQSILHRGG